MSKDNNDLSQVFGEIRDAIGALNQKIDDQNQTIEKLKDVSGDDSEKLFELDKHAKKTTIPTSPPVSPKAKVEKPISVKDTVDQLRELEEKVERTQKNVTSIDEHLPPTPPKPKQFKKEVAEVVDDYPVPRVPKVEAKIIEEKYEKDEVPEAPQSTSKHGGNMEEEIGVKWFAYIGMFVLFLGVSFFLKYAFDHDWISELGRVLMGVAVGLGFLAIGEKTIEKYELYGKVTSAGGLGVLYLSVYASYNFYSLIPYVSSLAFMGIVTGIGVFLSLRYNCQKILIASVVAGFLTPFLIKSGHSNQLGLFSYLVLLDAGILYVSFMKKWRWLNLIGFIGTFFVLSDWMDRFYGVESLTMTMLFFTLFFLMYSISSLAFNVVKKEESTGTEQVMSLLTGILFFTTGYVLMNPSMPEMMGFFAFIMALYYGLLAYLVYELTPKDSNLYTFLGFLGISFISLAIPIQFSKYVITLAWAVEGVLLIVLSTMLKGSIRNLINFFGISIFAIATVRALSLDGLVYDRGNLLFLNKVFIPSLFIIVGCYIITYAYKFSPHRLMGEAQEQMKKAASIFLIFASFMTVITVTRDISLYHNNLKKEITSTYNTTVKADKYDLDFRMQRQSEKQEKLEVVNESAWFWESMFWLVYGLVIMLFGVIKKEPALFWGANALITFIVFKVSLQDMWMMDSGYRILLTMASILACYGVASIFYNNLKTLNKQDGIEFRKLILIILVVANVMSVFFGSNEINNFYAKKVKILEGEVSKVCTVNTSKFSYNNAKNIYRNETQCIEYRADLKMQQNIASVAMSIFWMIYAIVLLIIGFARNIKSLRLGAITLLLIAIIKLFIIDLWSLGQLYRIISFTSLGAVLLAISFAYHKYKDKFKEIL